MCSCIICLHDIVLKFIENIEYKPPPPTAEKLYILMLSHYNFVHKTKDLTIN